MQETNYNDQISNVQNCIEHHILILHLFLSFEHLNFVLVSDFGQFYKIRRASDFHFLIGGVSVSFISATAMEGIIFTKIKNIMKKKPKLPMVIQISAHSNW